MQALINGARSRIYGRVRNVDGVVFKASHGTNSEVYTLLVAIAGHEIDFVEQVYFDDLPITMDSNGWVTSAPFFKASVATASEQFSLPEGGFTVGLAHVPIGATATYQYTSYSTEGGSNAVAVPLFISGSTVSGAIDTLGESATGMGTLTVQYQWNNGSSKARVRPYLGNSRPDLLTDLMADLPGVFTATDRFDGIALLRVDLIYDSDVFSSSGVPQVSAVMRGARVYDPRNGLTVWSQNPALCARDWALQPRGGALTADILDSSSFIAAANACDVASNFYVQSGGKNYVTNGVQSIGATSIGVTFGAGAISAGSYVTFGDDPNRYLVTVGIANSSQVLHIAAPGLLMAAPLTSAVTSYMKRTEATYLCGTVARTDQDPWATFNEMVEAMAGKAGWPGGRLRVRAGSYAGPVASITEDWISGVDSIQIVPEPPTDEAINIYSPTIANAYPVSAGTAAGYTTNGVYAVGATSIFVDNGAGTLPAGEYVTFTGDPNIYLLENGVTGPGQFLSLASPGLLAPIPTPFYVIPLGDLKTAYVAAPAPDVRAEAYIALDGRELVQETTLSAVTDVWHAQHVCGVLLRDSRNGLTVTLPCNMRAFQLEMFDVVTVTLARFGWNAKTFEVLGWQFSLTGGVTLTLKETTASIFQIDAGFSQIDQTPNTNLPDWRVVTSVTGLVARSGTDQLLVMGDGTIVTRILLTWDEITDQAVLDGGKIEIRYGPASVDESLWQSKIIPGSEVQTYLDGVQDGTFYIIMARASNGLASGKWGGHILHLVAGKTEPPPDVTTFNVAEQPDGRRIYTWTMDNPPVDLHGFRIRYSNLLDGTPWESMIPLSEPGALARTLELYEPRDGEYTISIKAVDTTGNESKNVCSVNALFDATSIGALLYMLRPYETGWPGIKDGCYVDGYTLFAESADTWDTVGITVPGMDGTWDGWTGTWAGTPVTPIYYTEETVQFDEVTSVCLRESSSASGAVSCTYQSSLDGSVWTEWAGLPAGAVSALFVRVRWAVTGSNPVLQRAQLGIYAVT
jgi:hypothetical protein